MDTKRTHTTSLIHSFCIIKKAVGKPIPGPTLLEETERWRVFHKLDQTFGKPKAYAIFQVRKRTRRRKWAGARVYVCCLDPNFTPNPSPPEKKNQKQIANPLFSSSPKAVALTRLLKTALFDALTEFAYPPALAGLSFDVDYTVKGLRVTVGGYHDKLPDFGRCVRACVGGVGCDVPRIYSTCMHVCMILHAVIK